MRTNHRSAILLALFLAGPPVQAEDISSFWRDTLKRLATEPIDAREADVREPLPYKSMRVAYRSLGGVRVRALLALPIRGGAPPSRLPAIATIPAYGGPQPRAMLDP